MLFVRKKEYINYLMLNILYIARLEIFAEKLHAHAIEGSLNSRNLKREVRLIATCPNIRLRSFDDGRSTSQSRWVSKFIVLLCLTKTTGKNGK